MVKTFFCEVDQPAVHLDGGEYDGVGFRFVGSPIYGRVLFREHGLVVGNVTMRFPDGWIGCAIEVCEPMRGCLIHDCWISAGETPDNWGLAE